MKTRVLFIIVLSSLLCTAKGQDATSNLEVWYKFDYVSGNEYLNDYSGNQRHIVPSMDGQDQDWANMRFETALIGQKNRTYVYFPSDRIDGIYLSAAKESNYWQGITGTTARTFCSWFRIDTDADLYSGKVLYSYGNENQTGGLYRIALKGESVEFENAVNNQSNDWCNRNQGWTNTFAKDSWHHLALVYDGTGGRQSGFRLYINGAEIDFPPVSGTNPDYSINTAGLYPPEIGRYMIKMAIADLRFYSRALTPADIAKVMEGDESTSLSETKIGNGAISYQNNRITVCLEQGIKDNLTLHIYNSVGTVEKTVSLFGEGAQITIPCSDLTPGIKIARVKGRTLNISGKIAIP